MMDQLFGFYIHHKSPTQFRLRGISKNGFKSEKTFVKGDEPLVNETVLKWVEEWTNKQPSIVGTLYIPGYGQTIIVKVN
ncbi:hypothetical protein EGD17_05675 [Salmonella enterica]|nr:hypothetical protein [Salmonella enterica]ECL8515675.1 hypothetical protein [Salmonella enterica]